MIKQTPKPIQLTKSMLINILRDMEAKHLKVLPYTTGIQRNM